MSRKPNVEENEWSGTPRRLPLKYSSRAIIPGNLTLGDHGPWEYVLEGGEKVRIRYVCTCIANRYSADMEKTCQELYGLSFEQVMAVWTRRLGRVEDWWHIVELIKTDEPNATRGE